MNYVFNEDHASIIYSKEVPASYNAIINEFYEKQNASLHQPGGHIKIQFKYKYPSVGVRQQAMFMLRREGRDEVEAMSYFSDYDNGKLYGPFPPGKYCANMLVSSGRSERADIPVTIENGKTKPLDFLFIPDGEIIGYVTTSLKKEEKAPGRPNIIYQGE